MAYQVVMSSGWNVNCLQFCLLTNAYTHNNTDDGFVCVTRKEIHLSELGENKTYAVENGTKIKIPDYDSGEPYDPLAHRNVDHPTS